MTQSSLWADKWRGWLRDINFWLDGFHSLDDAHMLFWPSGYAFCNIGVRPMGSFKRVISDIFETYSKKWVIESGKCHGHCEVIKIDLKPTTSVSKDIALGKSMESIRYQLALAIVKKLGIYNEPYNRFKKEHDEMQYYTYGYESNSKRLEYAMWEFMPRLINNRLSGMGYLLMVDNLEWPIDLGSFTTDVRIPIPKWVGSRCLISTSSPELFTSDGSSMWKVNTVISFDDNDHVVHLTLHALYYSSKQIFSIIHGPSEEHWRHIALRCFLYALTIFSRHSLQDITSDELIHQWAAQGILLPPTATINNTKYSDVCQIGRVILKAFQDYSLLQLPFFPAHEPTKTAAHFIAHHGLVAEEMTMDENFDNKDWIAFNGFNGWHVSREWLSQQEASNGPESLILRGCSHESLILSILDSLFPKHCLLRVLDLSCTSLKSLPSSIGYLTNLRLLCLRGCNELKTLSSSSAPSITYSAKNTSSLSPLSDLGMLEILDMNGVPITYLTQDMVNQKSNLIYLDMSYSHITTFPPSFFRDMSNLEELILVNCFNLVELPHSMVALSSLTTLEIKSTQIKYFPSKMFEGMKSLQSLKLVENNKLTSVLPSPIHGLIDPYTEGCESIMVGEIKLEGHPTLISLFFTGTPHIKRLSLRGCKKLEYVELENLDNLEELNMSGTAIKELSVNIPNLPKLKRLLLIGVPCLKRFPWHDLQRIPDVFCLDQCAQGNGNHLDNVAQVHVHDFRFFCTFGDSVVKLVRDGCFFQFFNVRVAPCITNCKQLQDEEIMLDNKLQAFMQRQSTYLDVYSRCIAKLIWTKSPMAAPFHSSERHVEITGMQQEPTGLNGLLAVTKSISVVCDTSINYFCQLSKFSELEECELRWCHKMERLFCNFSDGYVCLRNLHICSLSDG